MRKIGLLCLALVLALGTLGIGYATWSANTTIEQEVYSGEICMEFMENTCQIVDPGLGGCRAFFGEDLNVNGRLCNDDPIVCNTNDRKDVGSCNCTLMDRDPQDGHLNIAVVSCNNTYPSYYNHADVWVCNCGTVPWKVKSVDLLDWNDNLLHTWTAVGCVTVDLDGDPTCNETEIKWGDNFGAQVEPNHCIANMSWGWHILQCAQQNHELKFKIRLNAVQFNKF